MKISPVTAKLSYVDRLRVMTNVIAAFRNFANAPENVL